MAHFQVRDDFILHAQKDISIELGSLTPSSGAAMAVACNDLSGDDF
jgi:hypothetical protein